MTRPQSVLVLVPPFSLARRSLRRERYALPRWACVFLAVLTACGLARADSVMFKQGSDTPFVGGAYGGTEDSSIGLQYYTESGGASTNLLAGYQPTFSFNPFRSLIRFDVSALAGQYDSVNSVTLKLYLSADIGAGSHGVFPYLDLYRMDDANAGWVEGSGNIDGVTDPGTSTWDQRVQGSEQWTGGVVDGDGGGALGALLASQAYFNGSATSLSPFSLTVTGAAAQTLIDDWATGTNAGMLLRTRQEHYDLLAFYSSESSSAEFRPELLVDFNAAVPVVPLPSAALMGLSLLGALGLVSFRRRSREV